MVKHRICQRLKHKNLHLSYIGWLFALLLGHQLRKSRWKTIKYLTTHYPEYDRRNRISDKLRPLHHSFIRDPFIHHAQRMVKQCSLQLRSQIVLNISLLCCGFFRLINTASHWRVFTPCQRWLAYQCCEQWHLLRRLLCSITLYHCLSCFCSQCNIDSSHSLAMAAKIILVMIFDSDF